MWRSDNLWSMGQSGQTGGCWSMLITLRCFSTVNRFSIVRWFSTHCFTKLFLYCKVFLHCFHMTTVLHSLYCTALLHWSRLLCYTTVSMDSRSVQAGKNQCQEKWRNDENKGWDGSGILNQILKGKKLLVWKCLISWEQRRIYGTIFKIPEDFVNLFHQTKLEVGHNNCAKAMDGWKFCWQKIRSLFRCSICPGRR